MTKPTKLAIGSVILTVIGIGIFLWFGHWEILLGLFFLMWGDNMGKKVLDYKKAMYMEDTLATWKKENARKRN